MCMLNVNFEGAHSISGRIVMPKAIVKAEGLLLFYMNTFRKVTKRGYRGWRGYKNDMWDIYWRWLLNEEIWMQMKKNIIRLWISLDFPTKASDELPIVDNIIDHIITILELKTWLLILK